MSTFHTVPFEVRLKETEEEMKTYPGVTDLEAHVMAMCIVLPRGWSHKLSQEGISTRKSRRLLISGSEKYVIGGGKYHWQGMAERMGYTSETE